MGILAWSFQERGSDVCSASSSEPFVGRHGNDYGKCGGFWSVLVPGGWRYGGPMGVAENKAVVRRWVEITNAQDLGSFGEVFSEDTFDHVGGRSGIEWWQEVFGFLYATLPDWHWTLEDLVGEGDKVVARLTVRGTHHGSAIPFLRGVAPTGRTITWTHHHTFRFRGSRIVEHWANRDDLGFLRQVTAASEVSP